MTDQQEAAAKRRSGPRLRLGTPVEAASDTVAGGRRRSRPTRPRARPSTRAPRSPPRSPRGKGTVAVPDVDGPDRAGGRDRADRPRADGRTRPATPDDNPNFPQGQVTKTDPAAAATVASGTLGHAVRLHRQRRRPGRHEHAQAAGARHAERPEADGQHVRGRRPTRRRAPSSPRTRRRHAGQAGHGRSTCRSRSRPPPRPSRTIAGHDLRPTRSPRCKDAGLDNVNRIDDAVRPAEGPACCAPTRRPAPRCRSTSRSTSTSPRARRRRQPGRRTAEPHRRPPKT